MKLRTKMLLVVAILILAIPMVAGAARYKGDGATQDAANGYWDLPPVSPAHSGGTDTNCLECHGSGSNQYNCSGNCLAPDKSSYLLTGHKNILRKVVPGKPWAGPAGIYTVDEVGDTFDWVHGKVTVGGVAHPLFYMLGDWMALLPRDIFDKNNDGLTAITNEGSSYGCASCHTTGYNSVGAAEPAATFPTITSGITGKWWFDGIQCERCHKDDTNDYGGHNCYINGVVDPTKTNYAACAAAKGTYTVNAPRGGSATARCSECHLSGPDPVNISKVNVSPAGTAVDFGHHILGKEFLNSPHARFTGTMAQLTASTGKYSSHFSDGTCSNAAYQIQADCKANGGTWTSFQGGCTTCHDVHQSTVPEINAASTPMKNACGINCHNTSRGSFNPDLSTIRHPYGTGTPLEDPSDITGVCKTCHMPVTAAGVAAHLFRINVDPNYSTFPTLAQYNAGQKTANTYRPDVGSNANWDAVWIDLDLACGQCHGGGVNGAGAKVYPLSKAQLAVYAKGMHSATYQNPPPTAAMTAAPTVTGHTVTFIDNSKDPQDPQYNLRISVSWGDGKMETGQPGGTFLHTYRSAGTFTIRHTATDTEGLTGYESVSVVVP